MKQQIIRHGEVLLKPINELPSEVVLQEKVTEKIVAHSETGHHHILRSKKPFSVYSFNGKTYIGTIEDAMLVHAKTGTEVHTPHKVVPAFYEVIIKKSFNYFSKIMERVRD